MASDILVQRDGAILTAVLNRPDALNALNTGVLADLHAVIEQAEDQDVRVIVLKGSIDRAFCAGADLQQLEGRTAEEGRRYLEVGQQLCRRLERSRVPSIAVVDGFALGGGFELALSCSFILAGTGARFGLPEAKLGLIPGYGGTQRLVRALGKGPALQLMLTGELLDASAAWQLGLVADPPVPPEELENRLSVLARAIARTGPLSVAYILEAVRGTHPSDADLDHEAVLGGMAIGSEDALEGIAAFRERREPRFSGR